MNNLRYTNENQPINSFLDERDLIQKCKRNEYSAQMTVYNSYKDMMYNVSYRIVSNRHDAEDLVQESFIKGFEKIEQLKEDVSLGAWLKRIVTNCSLDHVRKQKKKLWIDEGKVFVKEEAEEIEIEEPILFSVHQIKECINNLKEKYRIILVLYLIEDYNHREISEMLQLKESTVRNQYKRGKDQLMQMIDKIKRNEVKRIHTES